MMLGLRVATFSGVNAMKIPDFFPIKIHSGRSMFASATFSSAVFNLDGLFEFYDGTRSDGADSMFLQMNGVDEIVWTNQSSTSLTSLQGFFRDPRVKKIKMTGWSCPNVTNLNNMFSTARVLEYLDCRGSIFGTETSCASMFIYDVKLTQYWPHESGFHVDVSLAHCPLDVDSAIRVMNALKESTATCTLNNSLKSTYEASSDFVAARDDAISRGWTIEWR